MTFGGTGLVRDRLGLNGGLDKCSFDYRSAQGVMGHFVDGAMFVSNFTGVGVIRLGAPRVITGYTRHGLEQAIGREGAGVSPRAILHTVKDATPSQQVEKAHTSRACALGRGPREPRSDAALACCGHAGRPDPHDP
jgi:hypothetical protein